MSLNQSISLLPKALRLMMTPSLCNMILSAMVKKAKEYRHNITISSFFLMMPHGHFSKVEKTQDFVLHGDRLRQMSGYFASFPEWPKQFELVTGEDGCRVSLISGGEDGGHIG
jgi:hypothetical protein